MFQDVSQGGAVVCDGEAFGHAGDSVGEHVEHVKDSFKVADVHE